MLVINKDQNGKQCGSRWDSPLDLHCLQTQKLSRSTRLKGLMYNYAMYMYYILRENRNKSLIILSKNGYLDQLQDLSSRKHAYIILTPLKPHFYLVKLGFRGVYIIFLISAQNIDCGYSLEPPRRGGSNEYPQSMFWAEIWKISEFFIWKFSVFGGEIFYIFE